MVGGTNACKRTEARRGGRTGLIFVENDPVELESEIEFKLAAIVVIAEFTLPFNKLPRGVALVELGPAELVEKQFRLGGGGMSSPSISYPSSQMADVVRFIDFGVEEWDVGLEEDDLFIVAKVLKEVTEEG